MEQRALASSLTALSMALGVAVMICVLVIHSIAVRQFSQDAQGYHLIVGGKGGELQLVLSTVFHLGQPLYPIPYSYYQKFQPGGEFANVTEVAVPVCLGDSYESPGGRMFRVVGTTPDLFDKIEYGAEADGTPRKYKFQTGGRNLRDALSLPDGEFEQAAFEAVVGSVVAAHSGLKVGDEINPTHGIGSEGHKHDGFKVVGILEPTGTANDRAVFVNIEGFYLLEGHALSPIEGEHAEHEHGESPADEHDHEHADEHGHEHNEEPQIGDEHPHDDAEAEHARAPAEHEHSEHDPDHDEDHDHEQEHAHDHDHVHDHVHHDPLPIGQREVTSILVLCNSELGPMVLDTAVNKGEDRIAQAVAPSREVTRLLENFVGPVQLILLVLTILIVIVAAISILVSIYNSMSERSHDIAVMRALGASRQAVMMIILVESILLALLGGVAGILLGHAIIGMANPYVEAQTGVTLGLFQFDRQELIIIPALVLLASIVGFLPAATAYRTDVAKALAGSR